MPATMLPSFNPHLAMIAPPAPPISCPPVAIAAANPPGRVETQQLLQHGARLFGLLPPSNLGSLRHQLASGVLQDMAHAINALAAAGTADIMHDGEYQHSRIGARHIQWLKADFPAPLAATMAQQLADDYLQQGKLAMAMLADEWAEKLQADDWAVSQEMPTLAAPAAMRRYVASQHVGQRPNW